jgi:hypothetical protein
MLGCFRVERLDLLIMTVTFDSCKAWAVLDTYLSFMSFCPRLLDTRQYCPKVKGQDIYIRESLYNTK